MRSAIVVGAGVGGLAAAGGLARSGWRVTLIEQADRLRGCGAAMLIWPNGAAALDTLGVSLGDIAFPAPSGGVRRPDGRWLVERQRASTVEPVVVHADDLHDALMAGLGESIEIRTGTRITSVRTGPDQRPAVITAKHTFEADLVVAADGSRSVIRSRLAPQTSVASAGYTAWRAVIPWYRAPKFPDGMASSGVMVGAGHHFRHAVLGERGSSGGSTRGGIYWVAIAPGAPRPESPATQLALLRRWFAHWQAPVGGLLEATEPEDLLQQSGEQVRPFPARFHSAVGPGGVVILGDAAHVHAPDLSQGACLAFEDAVELRAAVRAAEPGPSLIAGLETYTRARHQRTARVARVSWRLGQVLHAQGRLGVSARDVALARVPRFFDRAESWAAQWRPPSVP